MLTDDEVTFMFELITNCYSWDALAEIKFRRVYNNTCHTLK
jgi:hypothetical protein